MTEQTRKMVYSAIEIADEFLRIGKGKGKSITPLQLMKLVYIAHGWSFPVRKSDLFRERIEAWKYGPVIPDLYHLTKKFGRDSIPFDLIGEPDEQNVDRQTRIFLEDVFKKYGDLSGVRLSNLTHMPGTPWDQVYEPGVLGKEIPDTLIRDHYNELFDDFARSSAARV